MSFLVAWVAAVLVAVIRSPHCDRETHCDREIFWGWCRWCLLGACAPVAALLLAAWVWAPALSAGFVYEDTAWNRSAGWIALRPRVLMSASWWLQAHVTPELWAFHAVNVALHLTVSALVGLLAARLGGSRVAAVVAAWLMLVHPMTVEAVAYLSSRTELFAALGVVAACVLAASGRYVFAGMALLFGLASKETASIGFVLVPVTVWLAPRRAGLAHITSGLVAIVAALATLALCLWMRNVGEDSPGQVMGGTWLLLQASAVVRLLLSTLLFGFGQTVDFDYDLVPTAWRWGAIVLLLGLAEVTWRLWRRPRASLVAFGLVWAFVVIIPRLIVQTPRSYFNEHQWYLALPGLAIAAAAGVDVWIARRRKRVNECQA